MSNFYFNSVIPIKTDTRTPFYDDPDLLINSTVGWSASTPEIINYYELESISKVASHQWEILQINYCNNLGFFVVHIWKHRNASNNKFPIQPAELGEINNKIKKKFDITLFVFNIYETDTRPITPIPDVNKCIFTAGTPDTKDGSIIIGG